jgi:hypothetical protein
MKRRTVLQALTGGIVASAGCLSTLEEYRESDTAEDQATMNVSVREPDDAAMVSIGATLVEEATEDHPARIRVRLTNDAESQRTFRFGSSPPLSTYVSDRSGEDATLVLVPDDTSNVSIEDRNDDSTFRLVPDQPTDGCWQVVDRIVGQDILQSRTVESGGSVTETFTVLAGADNDPCVPADDYRFEAGFEVGEQRFDWSLVVSTTGKN